TASHWVAIDSWRGAMSVFFSVTGFDRSKVGTVAAGTGCSRLTSADLPLGRPGAREPPEGPGGGSMRTSTVAGRSSDFLGFFAGAVRPSVKASAPITRISHASFTGREGTFLHTPCAFPSLGFMGTPCSRKDSARGKIVWMVEQPSGVAGSDPLSNRMRQV